MFRSGANGVARVAVKAFDFGGNLQRGVFRGHLGCCLRLCAEDMKGFDCEDLLVEDPAELTRCLVSDGFKAGKAGGVGYFFLRDW